MHNTNFEVDNDVPEVKKQVQISMVQYNNNLLSRLLD